jgi:hypothetical protein
MDVMELQDLAGRNGSGLCGDAIMLRDSLVVVSMPWKSPPEGGILTSGERLLSISG